jgi:hypothetical protein
MNTERKVILKGMKTNRHITRVALFLVSILMSVSAFSLDENAGIDDAKDKLKKAPEAQEEAKAGGATATAGQTQAEKELAIAKAATDPSAILTQLGFFGWTESSSDNNNIANTFLFQPVLPLSKSNVLRPALPVITTGGPDGKTGIGDLFLLDVEISQVSSGSWGWGGVASLPIATEDTMGSGKWEAGPMVMYINKKALAPKHAIFGILAYNQWSFAGDSDRSDVNKFTFQPIWVKHTNWGYVGWTDINATIDWKNDNQFSFPVGLRIGKVFHGKTPFNAYVQPYYTFNNKGKDDVWGIKLGGTFIKPGWLKH